jgi:hypothetical protein
MRFRAFGVLAITLLPFPWSQGATILADSPVPYAGEPSLHALLGKPFTFQPCHSISLFGAFNSCPTTHLMAQAVEATDRDLDSHQPYLPKSANTNPQLSSLPPPGALGLRDALGSEDTSSLALVAQRLLVAALTVADEVSNRPAQCRRSTK